MQRAFVDEIERPGLVRQGVTAGRADSGVEHSKMLCPISRIRQSVEPLHQGLAAKRRKNTQLRSVWSDASLDARKINLRHNTLFAPFCGK